MIGEDEVKKIALLSHLNLEEGESVSLANELNSILGYVDKLQKLDTTSVEPTSHVHGSKNIMRPDVTSPSMPTELALSNTPELSGRFIKVPIIIEQNGEN
ncbi:MAG: Asp-tRNA(Asn)/Glu-tRNA(Gln) amidotransferase subunit GatC [Deltaproteobacteria bacterium]|nr:Asp-tRNA(Asn)/Glu-tRNA(Gln) amidotransferase subunit GatC [Deltaproteobacteria bacterium]